MKTLLHSPLLQGSLLDEEISLELDAVRDGVARYRRLAAEALQRGDAASLKPAERLLLHWFRPAVEMIRDKQDSIRAKKCRDAGVQVWHPPVIDLDAERLAVIALHEMLSRCLREPDGPVLSSVLYPIGSSVLAEIGNERLKNEARDDFEVLTRRFRALSVTIMNRWAKKCLTDYRWNRTVCVGVGACLLNLVVSSASVGDYAGDEFLPAFSVELRRRGLRKTWHLSLCYEAHKIIDDGHERRQFMRPTYQPMIVPPYPWQTITDENGKKTIEGGYVKNRAPYISRPTQEQKRALEDADLAQVNDCRSAVECTPWRVNRRLYAVQVAIYNAGGGVLGIPLRDELPRPPHPEGYDGSVTTGRWRHVSPEAKAAYKKLARGIIKANIRSLSDRQSYAETMDVARRHLHRSELYFPHQFDFRGRSYPLPIHLNHQRDDVRRGILEFAAAKNADSDSARRALLIEAANLYGIDKVPFSQRVQWALDNFANIRRAAQDPLADDWWRRAGEKTPGAMNGDPWQFLAVCFALTDPEAAAHAPTRRDGSCNGLQHYAALARDEVGARAVNLVPCERPADVYGEVAASIKPKILADAAASDAEITYRDPRLRQRVSISVRKVAAAVAEYVRRQGCKGPVMTSCYGVTAVGARNQVREYLAEMGLRDQMLYAASKYMAAITLSGIGEVCAGARSVMDWLKECGRTIADDGHLVSWTTPLGFPVVQPYRKWRVVMVKTIVGYLNIQIQENWVPVDVRKQEAGAAPNFVHSVDQTHKHMTARACRAAGVTFADVHDSFWTHAADRDTQDRILREQFVELHQRPILRDLVAQWRSKHPNLEFQDPPPPGNLDISRIIESEYAFS